MNISFFLLVVATLGVLMICAMEHSGQALAERSGPMLNIVVGDGQTHYLPLERFDDEHLVLVKRLDARGPLTLYIHAFGAPLTDDGIGTLARYVQMLSQVRYVSVNGDGLLLSRPDRLRLFLEALARGACRWGKQEGSWALTIGYHALSIVSEDTGEDIVNQLVATGARSVNICRNGMSESLYAWARERFPHVMWFLWHIPQSKMVEL